MNESYQEDDENNIPHGTQVLKQFVLPRANTDRIICVDSYISSVPADEEFWNHGIRFIGIINTAMWKFSMAYLSNIDLHNLEDISGLLTRPVDSKKTVLVDFFWMDRDRQYLIFTGVFMEKGRTYTNLLCSQEDPTPNADPNVVELTTPQPITADIYYSAFGKIYRHNMCHQESLNFERKFGTKYLSNLFNLSMLEINLVDFLLE